MSTILVMVCTKCQSKEVIRVQNEFFCTNCGQTFPIPAADLALEIDNNGLPDGVKILDEKPPVTAVDNQAEKAQEVPAVQPEDTALVEEQAQNSEKTIIDVPSLQLPEADEMGDKIEDSIGENSDDSGSNSASEEANESDSPMIIKHSQPAMAEKSDKPKKRKVGRPKASRLDVPIAAAAINSVISPKVAEAPKIHDPSFAPDVKVKNTATVVMSDLRPAKRKTDKANSTSKNIQETPVHAPQTKRQSIKTGDILADSWKDRFRLHHSLYAFVPALIIAIVAGGVTAAILSTDTGQLLKITKSAAIPVIGDLVIILAIYYICRSLATSAITFAAARSADHRKVPTYKWLSVGINSFGGKLRFDLIMSAAELVTLALVAILIITGGTAWPVPEYVQIGAIFISFLALMYAFSGLALTQGLGRVAVILGKTTSRRAFTIGWSFFKGHFELVAVKIYSLLLELIIIVPLVAAVMTVGLLTAGNSSWWFILALTVSVAFGGACMGAGTAIWWESTYRQLVHLEKSTEITELLMGRQAEKSRLLPLITISILIIALVVAATVWPWLPWPAIK